MMQIETSMTAFKDNAISLHSFFQSLYVMKGRVGYTYQATDNGFVIKSPLSGLYLRVVIDDYEFTKENFDLKLGNKVISLHYLVEKMVSICMKIIRNRNLLKRVISAKDPETELVKLANSFYRFLYISTVDNLHQTKRVLKNAQ
jgi:hypothetical protein